MEQKLLCIPESLGEVKNDRLEKELKAGWNIRKISASSSGLTSVCWILLERPTSKMERV